MARDDEVKLIAYNLWEQEGCASDRDCEYWYRAEAIWEQQHQFEPMAASPARSSGKATARKSKNAAERKRSTKD